MIYQIRGGFRMTKTDYPIFADDGSKFCMRYEGTNGELIIEGPKGKTISVANFMAQIYNPTTAKTRRGKVQNNQK